MLNEEIHSNGIPGHYVGNAVKIYYSECRQNIWLLDAIDNEILITGE